MAVSQRVRNLTLPAAMVVGSVFHNFFDRLAFLLPYFIFLMLFITATGVSPRGIKFKKLHWVLLAFQMTCGVAVYFLLAPLDKVAAAGLMMVVFAPSAISSTVIAGMLGANKATVASFCFLSNVCFAAAAPLLLTLIGANAGYTFTESMFAILSKVWPLIIIPFVFAWSLERVAPKIHLRINRGRSVSFWLWAAALTIVMGRTVEFIIVQPAGNYTVAIILASGALAACLLQFTAGRHFGLKYGEEIAGGQSLGQKNTVLAIWMTQIYFNPLVSLAPAAYVVWQNIVNSWQLRQHRRKPLKGTLVCEVNIK